MYEKDEGLCAKAHAKLGNATERSFSTFGQRDALSGFCSRETLLPRPVWIALRLFTFISSVLLMTTFDHMQSGSQ